MSKFSESELNNKLKLFRKKRNYLEKHPSKENINKLNKIYKKIDLIYDLLDKIQFGGLGGDTKTNMHNILHDIQQLGGNEPEPDDPEINGKHVIIEKDANKKINVENKKEKEEDKQKSIENSLKELANLEENRREKNKSRFKRLDLDKSKEEEEEEEEEKEQQSKGFFNFFKKQTPEEKEEKERIKFEKLEEEEEKLRSENPLYKKYKEEFSGTLDFKEFNTTKDFLQYLLDNSKDWNSFFNFFENIFIENALYFKEEIFQDENNLELFLIILRKYLFTFTPEQRIEKLQNIQYFYPELFRKKTNKISKNLFGRIFNVKQGEPFIKSLEVIGKPMFENNKDNIQNSIDLADIFPEFMNKPQFCKLIKDSKNILDILHLLPYLKEETCKDNNKINWIKKFNDLMNKKININDKNEYLLLLIMSIPNTNSITKILKEYRYKYNYNYYILKNLLSILNYDKTFMDKIKEEELKNRYVKRIEMLQKSNEIYEELWLWILKYAIRFEIKSKQKYFDVLLQYINFGKNIYENKEKNVIPDIKSLKIKENLKFLLNKLNEKNNSFDEFINLLKNNYEYFDDVLNDKKFNIEVYKLLKKQRKYYDNIKIKNVLLNKDNIIDLAKIKFHLDYDKIDSSDYVKKINLIDEFTNTKDLKKLPANIYIKNRYEINNEKFEDLLFYDNFMLSPEVTIKQIIFRNKKKLESKEKENEEIKDVIDDGFNEKGIDEKLKILEEKVLINEEDLQTIRTITNKRLNDKKFNIEDTK